MIRSQVHPEETYIGLTSDLKLRMAKHNEGGSPHTAKYKPWSLDNYLAFSSRQQAANFEAYLKSGTGRALAAK
jgi:predicted GIY-YIG superfamily endonuclease